ncbi:MAG: DNA recombination protein RmuC [Desulfurivibrio sp.]|nr:MAG: DNA recombination protein RmuC [Desulfurivibrio sp.]
MNSSLTPLLIVLAAFGFALAGAVFLLDRRVFRRLAAERQGLLTEQAVLQERLTGRQEKALELESQLQRAAEANSRLLAERSELLAANRQLDGQLALLKEAREELAASFKALSADICRSNSESFLQVAKSTFSHFQEQARDDLTRRKEAICDLVKPLQESLQKVDGHVRQLEIERIAAYTSLAEQVKSMAASQARLQGETASLVRALRTPMARGRWGEMQLRRVVEMAGMVQYCDFVEQQTVDGPEGSLRPDMVIRLPNGQHIVVDSKASLQAYLEAHEMADDDLRLAKLQSHARQMRTHLNQLSSKAYWQQFDRSPEFVVMFVPGENFFSAALAHDPELIEFGVTQRVILATPTTLIALLRAVSYGWRQEQIAEHAERIGELGRTLFRRLSVFAAHFEELRRNLDRTVQSYNKVAGSFENRVLVSARKFQEMDASLDKPLPELKIIDKTTRGIMHENL